VPTLKAKGIFWREDRKCPPSAKVGLRPTYGNGVCGLDTNSGLLSATNVTDFVNGAQTLISVAVSPFHSQTSLKHSRSPSPPQMTGARLQGTDLLHRWVKKKGAVAAISMDRRQSSQVDR